MTLVEVLGILIAAISGVAIPMAVARRGQQRELEQRVNDHAVEIARLKESNNATKQVIDPIRQDIHELRNDVKEMTGAVARLEATFTARD